MEIRPLHRDFDIHTGESSTNHWVIESFDDVDMSVSNSIKIDQNMTPTYHDRHIIDARWRESSADQMARSPTGPDSAGCATSTGGARFWGEAPGALIKP
ncbi:hypothetical protein [Kitasatospora sp. NPDC094011]|uniref:hypothetical protein n=1 Tax=Kitasatospora sp. NPDC094011 TaxID=3364090 RepID=UPI003824932B